MPDDTTKQDWEHDGGSNWSYYAEQIAKRKYDSGISLIRNLPIDKYQRLHCLVALIEKTDKLETGLIVKREIMEGLGNLANLLEREYKNSQIRESLRGISSYLKEDFLR